MLRRRRRNDEVGATAVIVAVLMTVFLMVAALVVDLGLARDAKARSQNAADASALAAANVLYDESGDVDFDAAIAAAEQYGADNFGVTAWSGCAAAGALPFQPAGPCISFDSETDPTRVRVQVPVRAVDLAFTGLFEDDAISVSTFAVAELDPGQVIRCSLCVLGDGPHTIGNGDVTVTASSVHFNGSVNTGPNGVVSAIDHEITVEDNAAGNYTPAAQTSAGRIGDPLEWLAQPQPTTVPVRTGSPCSQGPGRYGNFDFPNGECHLAPGLYVITGAWVLDNNTKLLGDDLTIFATCGTPTAPRACAIGEAGGAFDAKNGSVNISAGHIPGVAIFYDRNNVSDVSVQGNGETNIKGTIYAKSARLYANGNSGNGVINSSIVVRTIYLNGNTSHLKVLNGLDQEWRFPPTTPHLDE